MEIKIFIMIFLKDKHFLSIKLHIFISYATKVLTLLTITLMRIILCIRHLPII